MIYGVKKELCKEIFTRSNIKVNMTEAEQGVTYPCFFCKFITNQIKSVATIDLLNIIDFDIVYYPSIGKKDTKEILDIVQVLNEIKKINFRDKEVQIERVNVDVIDGVLHYLIRLYVELEEKPVIEPDLETIRIIKKELEAVSDKKVYYINGKISEIKKGFFIIEPSVTETFNTGIRGEKEYEREIVIRYIDSNNNVDIYGYLEGIMDNLFKRVIGRNGVYKYNYKLDVSYDSEEYEELNVLNHELTLMLVERKGI